jgi:hypothetical protein
LWGAGETRVDVVHRPGPTNAPRCLYFPTSLLPFPPSRLHSRAFPFLRSSSCVSSRRIDEVHMLVGAGSAGRGGGGGLDIANLVKPALARGEFQVCDGRRERERETREIERGVVKVGARELSVTELVLTHSAALPPPCVLPIARMQVIGATTIAEFRKYVEKDAALERRFQPVMVREPTEAETLEILGGLREKYERHHRVRARGERSRVWEGEGRRKMGPFCPPDWQSGGGL